MNETLDTPLSALSASWILCFVWFTHYPDVHIHTVDNVISFIMEPCNAAFLSLTVHLCAVDQSLVATVSLCQPAGVRRLITFTKKREKKPVSTCGSVTQL